MDDGYADNGNDDGDEENGHGDGSDNDIDAAAAGWLLAGC